jgi:hypothetical protein
MKLMIAFLIVVLGTTLIPLNVPHVRAQGVCDAATLVNEMNGDLASYGGRVTAASDADLETLTILYFDLLDLRHRYEDRVVCDELGRLNDLMLQIIAEMEDLSFTYMAVQVNPASSEDYDLILERQILARNTATYEAYLAEAAQVVNATTVAAGNSDTSPQVSSGANGNSSGEVAIGEWHNYRDGRFRIVGIIDPYISTNWAQPRAGNRAIAVQMEISCDNPLEGECTANSLFLSDVSLSSGVEIARGETITLVGDPDAPRFYAPQRGTVGQLIGGWVYLEIPDGQSYTNMTVFDWTTLREVRVAIR